MWYVLISHPWPVTLPNIIKKRKYCYCCKILWIIYAVTMPTSKWHFYKKSPKKTMIFLRIFQQSHLFHILTMCFSVLQKGQESDYYRSLKSKEIRRAILKQKAIGERRIYVSLPSISDHSGHDLTRVLIIWFQSVHSRLYPKMWPHSLKQPL